MARKHEDQTFVTEAEARAYVAQYLAQWGGPFNPYDGKAMALPPNDDRPRWLVQASRNASAE